MFTTTSEVKKEYEEKIEELKIAHKKREQFLEDQLASKDAYIEKMLKTLEQKEEHIKKLIRQKKHLKGTIKIFEEDEREAKK